MRKERTTRYNGRNTNKSKLWYKSTIPDTNHTYIIEALLGGLYLCPISWSISNFGSPTFVYEEQNPFKLRLSIHNRNSSTFQI